MELLSIFDLEKRLKLSWATIDGMVSRGEIPLPLIVAGFNRWTSRVAEEWIGSGCPSSLPPSPREVYAFRRANLDEVNQDMDRRLDLLEEKELRYGAHDE